MEEKVKRMDSKVSIIDKPLSKGTKKVSLSAFSYIFSELVQYHQSRSDHIQQLESKLSEAGYGVGLRLLELLFHRERNGRRERNIINILRFIQSSVWRTLFGKPADGLQKCTERSNEYYIYDNEPITNRFVSVPKDMGQFNCAAYVAGIVNGFLDGAEFTSEVTAHFQNRAGKQVTVYVIKFEPFVLERSEK